MSDLQLKEKLLGVASASRQRGQDRCSEVGTAGIPCVPIAEVSGLWLPAQQQHGGIGQGM